MSYFQTVNAQTRYPRFHSCGPLEVAGDGQGPGGECTGSPKAASKLCASGLWPALETGGWGGHRRLRGPSVAGRPEPRVGATPAGPLPVANAQTCRNTNPSYRLTSLAWGVIGSCLEEGAALEAGGVGLGACVLLSQEGMIGTWRRHSLSGLQKAPNWGWTPPGRAAVLRLAVARPPPGAELGQETAGLLFPAPLCVSQW